MIPKSGYRFSEKAMLKDERPAGEIPAGKNHFTT